jgi:hypothetical protein
MTSKNKIEIIINAEDKANKVLGGVGKGLAGLGKIAAGAGVAVAGAATGIGVALGALAVKAAPLEGIGIAFDKMSERAGLSLDELREASAGTISDFELMRKANIALTGAGEDLGQEFGQHMPALLEAARAAARATGQDVDFLFESLVTGVKRGSPMLIDNTGLVIKLGEANEAMAAKLGKSVQELTAEEKQIALLNATVEAGKKMTEEFGGGTLTAAERLAKFRASIANLRDKIGIALLPALQKIVAIFGKLVEKYAPDIIAAFEKIGSVASEFIGGFAEALEGGWPAIKEFLAEWASRFWDWLTGPGGAMENTGDIVAGIASTIGGFLRDSWPTIAGELSEWAALFWDWISTDVIPVAQDKLSEISAAILGWAESPDTQDNLASIGETAGQALVEGVGALVSIAETWTPILMGLAGALSESASSSLLPALREIAKGLARGFIKGITDALGIELPERTLDALSEFGLVLLGPVGIAAIFNEAVSKVKESLGELSAIIGDTFEGAKEIISMKVAEIKNKIVIFVADAINFFVDLKNQLVGGSIVQEMMSAMLEIIQGALADILSAVAGFISDVVGAFSDLAGRLYDVGASIMEGLKEGILSKVEEILQAIRDIINNLIREAEEALNIFSPSGVFAEIGRSMMEGMALGIAGNAGLPAAAAVGAAAGVTRSTTNEYYFNQTIHAYGGTAREAAMGFETMRALVG